MVCLTATANNLPIHVSLRTLGFPHIQPRTPKSVLYLVTWKVATDLETTTCPLAHLPNLSQAFLNPNTYSTHQARDLSLAVFSIPWNFDLHLVTVTKDMLPRPHQL